VTFAADLRNAGRHGRVSQVRCHTERVTLEPRQLAILAALVESEEQPRAEDRGGEWILSQAFGGRAGFQPEIPNEASLDVTHADLLDLSDEGYLHELPYTSSGVLMKFVLTPSGRAAGRARPVVQEIGPTAPPPGAAPGADEVLAWIVALENSPGAGALGEGGMLNNQVIADFGDAHLEAVARRVLDLRDEGLVRFDDPAARIEQLSDSDRLGMGSAFRATAAGRDRVRGHQRPAGDTYINQVINAVNAQVAAGDIQNLVTFQALLGRAEQAIDELEEIDEQTRAEAKSLVDKLRGASGGVATSAAGAVVGAVLKQLLGLP
jgi:hypothetical protein